jgi:predicted nuclease with RNAse H fold
MVTLGVDFASQPDKTAACMVHWENGEAKASVPELGVDDERLIALATDAHRVGVDVPFGWPRAFVDAVAAHQQGNPWPDNTTRDLSFRATDHYIWLQTKKWPLSVSTDRIGITAFRAARIFSRMEITTPVDRSGKGKFIEVYPAAALRRWGLTPETKRNTPLLISALVERTEKWLRLSDYARALCEKNRDALDSVIAALVARAAALKLCDPIPADFAEAAEVEGWIALPLPDSLEKLPFYDESMLR